MAKLSDLPNLHTNDVLLLQKLGDAFKNSEHKDREFMVRRLEEIAFKLEALESCLVKGWVGAIAKLYKYDAAVGNIEFCRKNIRCYRVNGHADNCKVD